MSRRDHPAAQFERIHPSFETPRRSVPLTGTYILVSVSTFTIVFGAGPGAEAALHLPVAVPLVGAELHLGIEALVRSVDLTLLRSPRRADPRRPDRPRRLDPTPHGPRAQNTVIMAKRYLGLTSKLRRWLHWE